MYNIRVLTEELYSITVNKKIATCNTFQMTLAKTCNRVLTKWFTFLFITITL